MKQFFKFMFASMLGTFLTGIIVLILGVIVVFSIIAGISSFAEKEKTKLEDPSILKIELDRPIVDRGGQRRFEFNGPGDFSSFQELGLNNIIEALEKARHDERIRGVQLELSNVIAGMATMKELRDAIRNFRDSSDKFLFAYGKGYSQRSYYLASVADQLHLYPEGNMLFKGLVSQVTFFKGLLDKLDVEMQVVRGSNNAYKSAVEPFTRKGMSEESREQIQAYIEDLWDVYLQDISASRGIGKEQLNEIADSLSVRRASDAVEKGLVDELLYPDEFEARLRDSLDMGTDEELPYVSLKEYVSADVPDKHWSGAERDKDEKKKEGKVGVIYAMGAIQSGESESEVLGAATISKAIEKCREDSSIEAVVMRVNSPGGSALASDRIWREVELTREEKPFVVSMGDVAASGGYYISCGAERIFADPNTITGSIGVFGMIPHLGDMFENKLGIHFDQVKTNEYADLMNQSRPMREKEKRMIQERIDEIYERFLKLVAEGRDMTKEEVNELARGRVWSGRDAKRVGLVDELGGLEKAVAYANETAGLEDAERVAYPERKDPFERFFEKFGGGMQQELIERTIGKDRRLYRKYEYLRSVLDMKGYQARMPYHIEVR